jgi:hypothetical protein
MCHEAIVSLAFAMLVMAGIFVVDGVWGPFDGSTSHVQSGCSSSS